MGRASLRKSIRIDAPVEHVFERMVDQSPTWPVDSHAPTLGGPRARR